MVLGLFCFSFSFSLVSFFLVVCFFYQNLFKLYRTAIVFKFLGAATNQNPEFFGHVTAKVGNFVSISEIFSLLNL